MQKTFANTEAACVSETDNSRFEFSETAIILSSGLLGRGPLGRGPLGPRIR